MLKVIKSRPLQPDEDFQQWILLLLSLTEEGSAHLQAQCLQEVLSQQYNVTNKYSNYVSSDFHTSFSRSVYLTLCALYAHFFFL